MTGIEKRVDYIGNLTPLWIKPGQFLFSFSLLLSFSIYYYRKFIIPYLLTGLTGIYESRDLVFIFTVEFSVF